MTKKMVAKIIGISWIVAATAIIFWIDSLSRDDKLLAYGLIMGGLLIFTSDGRKILAVILSVAIVLGLIAWIGYMLLNSSIALAIVVGAALVSFAIAYRR